MNKTATKADKIMVGICLGTLICIFISITLTAFTRLILVNRLGIRNEFTAFIFAGNRDLNEEGYSSIDINWGKLYPFSEQQSIEVKKKNIIGEFTAQVDAIKENITPYVTSYLPGYNKEVELAKKYEDLIQWNFVSFGEYNGVSQMDDGYLTEYIEERDVDEWAESLISFSEYVEETGADFLYVQAPYKVSEYEDTDISGYMDHSNQNVDRMISMLKEKEVDVCDLREYIHNEGLHNHDLFYRTDGHWLTTSGVWGAKNILEYCNEKYDFKADTNMLNIEKFRQEIYPEWFLGAQGKKVTLARTTPDDFVLLYPEYDTELHYVVPSLGIDVIGDYSVTYDMEQLSGKDFYNKNPYASCNHGDQPLHQIYNSISSDDKKILIIHDSFADCLIPPLSLCEQRLDALDLRNFTGSVKAYLQEYSPDIVIVMYNPGIIGGNIDLSSHRSVADFR